MISLAAQRTRPPFHVWNKYVKLKQLEPTLSAQNDSKNKMLNGQAEDESIFKC